MDANLTKLAGSLPVPNVQELAKEAITEIPPRYVHTDQDHPIIHVDHGSLLLQVPVIDMNKLSSSNDGLMESELEKLHVACRDWGFFQLMNHGVSCSLVEEVKLGIQEFFKLPMEEKRKFWQEEGDVEGFGQAFVVSEEQKLDWGDLFLCTQLMNHGVSCSLVEEVKLGIQEFFKLPMEEKRKFWQEEGDVEGFGQAFVVSEEQKLDWGDLFYMVTLPRHLRKPHLFPMLPSPFRDALDEYSSTLRDLAMKVLLLIAKALKMDAKEMTELFDGGMQAFRMNYYPPCLRPEHVIGLTPHSDAVGLTILLQVNEMEGLQIRTEGKWIPVKPLPNAFVVNVGDILEAMVNSMKERLSIAAFYNPKIEGDMGAAPSLITPNKPALFKRIGIADYFRGFLSRELQGKSYLDVMRTIQGAENNGN